MASPTSGRPSGALLVTSGVVAGLFAFPVLYLVWRTLGLRADVVGTVTSSAAIGPLARTLQLAVAVSATSAVVGSGLAWLTQRTDVPGRRLWAVVAPLPLVFPSFVGAAALIAAVAPGGLLDVALGPLGVDRLPAIDGFGGAWLVLTLFTYPYVYLPVAARLGSLNPSLEESARLLGRSPTSVFATVVLPQTSAAAAAGTLLVFLYVVSDFGAVQLMRFDTLTRSIYANRVFDRTTSLTLSLLLAVVALVVVVAERSIARRRAVTEAVRASAPLQVPLGRWRWPACSAVAILVVNALLGPLSVLGYWAGRGLGGGGAIHLATDVGDLIRPTLNTAVISVATAAVAVAVVLPVAYLTARHRGRVAAVPNAVVVAGFALPGLVIALAVVFWLNQAPIVLFDVLEGSILVLVFAYVVHFGAQAMRAAQVAVAAVPRRLDDAARMLGAGRVRRFRTVELPLMSPGLLAGGGLVLLSTMKELPATLLLAPIGFDTLATRIWGSAQDGFLAETGLASLILVALSGALTWLFVVRRTERFA